MRGSIRVGVIGTGSIAQLTNAVLRSLEGVEVAFNFPARAMNAQTPVWESADLVAICSANGLHVTHAMSAVKAGKHVVIEKPLALDVASGSLLLEEARRQGVNVSVIAQRRFEPSIVSAKEAISSGALGQPVLVECSLRWNRSAEYYASSPWRGTASLDGGVLFNQGIHLIDLARWLMGPVHSLHAFDGTLARPIEAPDTCVAALRFESGALGVVAMTVGSHTATPAELNLHFERGTIGFQDDRLTAWSVPGIPPPREREQVGSGAQDPSAIGLLGHERQWKHIVCATREGRQPEVSGADALKTLSLIETIHASAGLDAGTQGKQTRAAVLPLRA